MMASRTLCFFVILGLLAGSSRSAYLGSPNQGTNGFSSGGHGGAGGGGFNNNGGVNGGGFNNNGGNGGNGGKDPIAHLANAIPGDGVPGQDYPILASVPDTGFVCQGQIPGYYADTDQQAGCQVFHICQEDNRQDSFLCPNGTIFNQQYFVCDWWFNFDCSTAEQFYGLNANIGQGNGNGNGNGNGYGGGNGNGFGNRDGGLGSSSGLSNSYGAPGTGNFNGGASTGTGTGSNGGSGGFGGNGGGGFGGNGGGGSPQAPSGLYQTPN